MLKSLAQLHYPYLVYRDNQKKLWDPVRKQTLQNRPEERVRQRLLNCFIMESLHPRSRISTESAVQSRRDSSTKRTDILCYDRSFNPQLLIECKAENVTINEQAAIQITRYNRKVGSPLLLLTNGVADYWYEVTSQKTEALDHSPSVYNPEHPQTKDFSYWSDRGFLGRESSDQLADILTPLLNRYWVEIDKDETSVAFLAFNQHPDHLILNHYYRVTTVRKNPTTRVALAFTASKSNHTHLVGIINREKENLGFIDINLKFLQRQEKKDMYVYSADRITTFDAGKTLSLNIENDLSSWFDPLPTRLSTWFFNTYLQS